MNIQHLRYFLKVMETGSISRAAGLLGVTQPTLSVALKRIEQEFGARLFAPDGRGIRPLAGAKLLEDRVRLAVRVLSEAKRDLTGSAPAALKIGLLQSLAENWLPRLGNAWDGPVAIVEALSDELEKQVRGGAIDLARSLRCPPVSGCRTGCSSMSPTCSSSALCTCSRDGGPSVLRSSTGSRSYCANAASGSDRDAGCSTPHMSVSRWSRRQDRKPLLPRWSPRVSAVRSHRRAGFAPDCAPSRLKVYRLSAPSA